MKLTNMYIKNLKPKGKLYKKFDGGGLYIEVKPSCVKTFRVAYRFAGRQKTLTIGPYPLVSLASARLARADAKSLLLACKDPSAEKQAKKARLLAAVGNTFEAVAQEYIRIQASKAAPGTIDKYEWCLAGVGVAFRRRLISDISKRDAVVIVQPFYDEKKFDKAIRMARFIKTVLARASQSGFIDSNVCYDLLDAFPRTRREVHHPAILDTDELATLMFKIRECGSQPSTKLGLQLLAVTAVRPGEMREAKWCEIDFKEKVWTIPAERMKMNREHKVPLPDQAVALLQQAKNHAKKSDYVLPAHGKPDKPLSENAFNHAIWRLEYKGKHTAHGFRSSVSTYLHGAGYDSLWIETQLSHADTNQIRSAYNSADYLEDRRKMMQDWADLLDAKVVEATQKVLAAAAP
jgi:integrase